MMTTSAVTTPHGAAYTRRLCKHFAHKIPAVANGNYGRIDFPFGICEIECDDKQMLIRVNVIDANEVERAERVVGDHLIRMANCDNSDPTVQSLSDLIEPGGRSTLDCCRLDSEAPSDGKRPIALVRQQQEPCLYSHW